MNDLTSYPNSPRSLKLYSAVTGSGFGVVTDFGGGCKIDVVFIVRLMGSLIILYFHI